MASTSSKSKFISVLDEDGNPTKASGRGQLYEKMSPNGAGLIRFGFVWFNYNDYNINALKELTRDDNVEYIIFNHEVCPTTGKKHLQGFCRLVKKKVFGTIKKLFEQCGGDTVEICKCILKTTNSDVPYITYSKKLESADPEFKFYHHKDDDRDPDRLFSYFVKFNKDPEKEEINKQQGCRNDLNTVIEWINDNPNEDWLTVMQTWPEQCARFNKFFLDYWNAKKSSAIADQYKKDDDKVFTEYKLLNYQQHIFDILVRGMDIFYHEDENIRNTRVFDDRYIYWIYDKDGGRGKTRLIDYVDWYSKSKKNFNCLFLNNAKTNSIALVWKNEPAVFFDFTKSSDGRINYTALEILKNGTRIFSEKYNSQIKQGRPCFICCVANFLPEVECMSVDRWKILYLYGGDKGEMSQQEFALSTEFVECNLLQAIELDRNCGDGNKQLNIVQSKLQKAIAP